MSRPWPPEGLESDAWERAPAVFDPATFDPKDPGFRDNPYPTYAQFRRHAPVCLVRHGGYESYWVFTHALVDQVNRETSTYLKLPLSKTAERGIFEMDLPRHAEVRGILDPLFAQATADAADLADRLTVEALQEVQAAGRAFDATPALANRVMRNVFMTTYGVPRRHWRFVGALVDTMLGHYDKMLPLHRRLPGLAAAGLLLLYFKQLAKGCPMHRTPKGLFGRIVRDGADAGMTPTEINATSLHFALGGYLSTQFLITTGLHHLVSNPPAFQAYLADPGVRPGAIEEMKRFDAPFQMADRFAAKDVRLGGCDIPAGAMVTVVYGSANHDADVFGSTAEQFDLHRTPQPELNRVFGEGMHRCIGAGLVADVMPVILGRIVESLPTLALGKGVPVRETDPYFRGFASLPLTT